MQISHFGYPIIIIVTRTKIKLLFPNSPNDRSLKHKTLQEIQLPGLSKEDLVYARIVTEFDCQIDYDSRALYRLTEHAHPIRTL